MTIGETNSRTWAQGHFARQYRATDLRPAEEQVLDRYSGEFSGHVLELGCGTGRVTGHLAARSDRVEAIDLSPEMLAEARKRHPEVTFDQMNMVEISRFEPGSFDAVIASCNVIDVLADDERRRLLGDVRDLLGEHGIFAFSSHNRGHVPLLRQPWQLPRHRTHPVLAAGKAVLHLPARLRNRRRLHHLEVHADRYEILNDAAHDWRLLQYYIYPVDSRRQLAENGLQMLECLTLDGHPVADGDPVAEETELYYIARPD